MAVASELAGEGMSREPPPFRQGAWRWALWSLCGVAFLAALGLSARDLLGEKKPPVQVTTVAVTVGDVERAVLAAGTIRPAVMVNVGAQVSGQLTRLDVEVGQEVRKGDLIAEIDSAPQRNAVRLAEEDLNYTRAQRAARQAQLEQFRLELRRQAEMVKVNATSRAKFEEVEARTKVTEAEVAALDAQIAQAETAVTTARVNLGYTQIRAPIDGTVVAIVTRRGQTVNANQVAPTIVKLARLDAMVVKVQVSEADVTKVQAGQEANFTILGEPDRRYKAVVRSIEPAPESISDEGTGPGLGSITPKAIYYNGLLEVPNTDGRLRIAMTAQVSIVLERAAQVPVVPSAALVGKGPSQWVEVQAADGSISCRGVEVGVNNNAVAEIRSGLSAGERVVVGPRPAGAPATTCEGAGA